MIKEWEAVDESLYFEAGEKDIVQVSNNVAYEPLMENQNKRVCEYLTKKYPNKKFKVSRWFPHEFGKYQEVLELHEYKSDYEEDNSDFV